MKRAAVAVLLVMVFSVCAYAEDGLKIMHIDLQRVLNESEEGKKAKVELEEMVKQRQGVIEQKVKQKGEMSAEYDKQALVLSEEARLKKQDEMNALEREIKRMISESNADVQKAQREKELKIIKELEALVDKLAEEKGYYMILPSDVVLYSVDGTDLTETVIEMYNKSLQPEKKPKGGG